MAYAVLKLVVSAALIVVISEIAKRSSFLAAVLASIPLVSVLAMIWLYVETRDVEKITALATSIFWLVIPSLVLFLSLPVLLRAGLHFYVSLPLSIGLTATAYFVMVLVLKQAGIEL